MMGDDGIYIARVMNEKLYAWRPSPHDAQCLSDNREKDWTNHGYYGTLKLLMLAGFCLMLCLAPASGEDVVRPTTRHSAAVLRNFRTNENTHKRPSQKQTAIRWQQSACPGGRCPVPTNRRRIFR